MSHRIRLALAAILLITFYAAVALTILIWVTLVVLMFDAAGSAYATTLPVTGFLFCAGTAVPVYALGDAARRSLFLVDTPSTPSMEVGRSRAAALHALVDDLAERLGISEPVRIRLHTTVGAEAVDEDSRFLGLSAGTHVLSVGLPLLAALPRRQIRAVMAHELAHLSLRHHRVRAFTLRLETSLTVARESLISFGTANGLVGLYVGLPQAMIGIYIRLFRRLVQPVRRRQELEADHMAARLCGASTLAEALANRAVVEPLWIEFQRMYLDAAPDGVLPADPFRAFARTMADPGVQDRLPALRAQMVRAPAAQNEFGASHPHLAYRLRRLTKGPDPAAVGACLPDAALLPDLLPRQVAGLLARYVGASTLPWQDWIDRWVDARNAVLVEPLCEAVRTLDGPEHQPVALHQMLHLLEAGQRMPLARALAERVPETHQEPDDPLALLSAALLALVRSRLTERPGPQSPLPQLVRDAVRQPNQVSRLSLHLARRGVDETAPAQDTPETGQHRSDEPEQAGYTTAKVSGGIPEAGRRVISSVRAVTLTVLIVVVAVGGLRWTARDKPAVVPPTRVTPTYSPVYPVSPPLASQPYAPLPSASAYPFSPEDRYRLPSPVLTAPAFSLRATP
ncbi:M48 family metalloprotease [Streptomyces avermitilis]|uniref:M48 family metallopeptidase n=1 Tax=Streptomyces avermitilis TaxID=33903 RepID=UPI0033C75169